MDNERWLPIGEFPGYEVSDLGNVRGPKGPKSAHCGRQGYLRVCFYRGPRMIGRMVHRLVMRAFAGPPRGRVVNHKNGRKNDPRLENLEYVTHRKNSQHAVATGLYRAVRGSERPQAVLHERDIIPIFKAVAAGVSRRDLAKRYPVKRTAIDAVILRRAWKHVEVPASLIAAARRWGRHANAGETNAVAKLTTVKVIEIFRRAKAGERLQTIANDMGVGRPTVSLVLNRTVWHHVLVPPALIPRRTASGRIAFVR